MIYKNLNLEGHPMTRYKTITTAKEYLSQIRDVNIRLKSLARQRQSLEDALYNISPKLSHTPKSATQDVHRMDGLIAAKLDIESEMETASIKLAEIYKTVSTIPAAELGAVLTYRYIDRLPWLDIAKELFISESRVYQLHREALAAIEEVLDSE